MNSYFPHLTALCLTTALVTGCATEHSRTLETPSPGGRKHLPRPKPLISVGKFDNRSSFMNGIFSDGVDRLGSQAKTILITHLQQSGRFNVLERDNMAEAAQEAQLMKKLRPPWCPLCIDR